MTIKDKGHLINICINLVTRFIPQVMDLTLFPHGSRALHLSHKNGKKLQYGTDITTLQTYGTDITTLRTYGTDITTLQTYGTDITTLRTYGTDIALGLYEVCKSILLVGCGLNDTFHLTNEANNSKIIMIILVYGHALKEAGNSRE